jgi:regulator of protease activity HflC (stomatin/prohibitin superfamily)
MIKYSALFLVFFGLIIITNITSPDIIAIIFSLILYIVGSSKVISENHEAIVERLGRFHRKLKAGLNFVVPGIDVVVFSETTKEKFLSIIIKNAISKNNIIYQEIECAMFWQIIDFKELHYNIENIEEALKSLTTHETFLIVDKTNLEYFLENRENIETKLFTNLNKVTCKWGIEIKRVFIQNIRLPDSLIKEFETNEVQNINFTHKSELQRKQALLNAKNAIEIAILEDEAERKGIKLTYRNKEEFVDYIQKATNRFIVNIENNPTAYKDEFSVGGSVGGNVNNVQGRNNRTVQGDNNQGILGDNNEVTQS